MVERTEILGVEFDNVTLDEAADRAIALMDQDGPHLVATPNPEIVQLARRDPEFGRVLSDADLVIPDGVGVVYAAKILGRPLKGRVPGIEFAAALMARMAGKGKRLFLLGAKPGVAELAAANLAVEYPGLVVCGTHDEESSALVRLYLGGAFGTHPSDVNAYAASTFYAVDRYAGYKQDWGGYYEGGGLMVADRYTTSNAVHQASKLPEG